MNTARIFSALHNIVEAYSTRLNMISEEQFKTTPPIGGWSYSEVYCHIFDASILSVDAVMACLDGKGEHKPTAFMARLILFAGAFPPGMKFKVPKRLESRVKIISKSEARDLIEQFRNKLAPNESRMEQASSTVKTAHPRLGYLNAKQWLRFIEVHLNHHLKQLQRIEKSF